MLNFLKDLFRPAAEPAKPKPRRDFDPHLGYCWHRSDSEEVVSRPLRFRMSAPKLPAQGVQRAEPTSRDLAGGGR